jgi:SAM-dependent methyltransferase
MLRALTNPRGKLNFIESLPHGARVLDVGCGNNSPVVTKRQRPDLYYVGLDVEDCRQDEGSIEKADRYIIAEPTKFAEAIDALDRNFGAVISCHNLEHCFEPEAVLEAMLRRLAPQGRLYTCFPCEASVNFPSRAGCLNFFDDPTHAQNPPDYLRVQQIIREAGFEITFATARYRPLLRTVMGALVEPASAALKRKLRGTWALYGFETVVCAKYA